MLLRFHFAPGFTQPAMELIDNLGMGAIEKCCLVLVLVGGCTKTISECTKDSDCTNIVYPFCDAEGTYAASGGVHNVCTIVPPDCSVERCGCTPGAVTCTADVLTTCQADGKSVTSDPCALGCDVGAYRCFTFKPTNGMDGPLTASAQEPPVTLPALVNIDTTACKIRDGSTNVLVTVGSLLVSQLNAPAICAFYASSFDITDATVTGTNVLGFAAVGDITIRGTIDEAAKHRVQGNLNAGPGAVSTGDCVGVQSGGPIKTGGGGGGNATAGGDGYNGGVSVPYPSAGGLAQQNFTPVFGGCAGAPTTAGGGGALQLDSLSDVHIAGTALLAFGGQGSEGVGAGGGAGGTIIIEAPTIEIAGGIAANGGGGGANGSCTDGAFGAPATNDGVAAAGGACNGATGGAGGTATTVADRGHSTANGAGCGGSVGRILIRTSNGEFTGPGSLFSIVKTTDTLVKH